MQPRDRKFFRITFFQVLVVSILVLGGCRRIEQKTDGSSTTSQPDQTQAVQPDLNGDELEMLIQNLESMNRDADALDDLNTLDEISIQDADGDEMVMLLQSPNAANQVADGLDDLAFIPRLQSGDSAGDELFRLWDLLSASNETADALIDLGELP